MPELATTTKIGGDFKRAVGTRLALVVLAISFLFALIGRGIAESLTVFILPLQHEFEGSRAAILSIFAASTIATGLGGPWMGMVSDRLGARMFYVGGILLLAVGCFLASEASAVWQLMLVLGLGLGLSSACLGMAGQTPLIHRWFPGRTGTAIGIIGSATGLGVLVFAPLAELLIQAYGWRNTYQIFAAVAGCLAAIALLLPWRRIEAGVSGVDGLHDQLPGKTFADIVGDPSFWGIFVAYFLTSAATLTLQPQLVAYFVHIGYEPLAAATWIGVGGIAGCAGMIGFGWLGDRLGVPTAIILSYVATAAGILVLAAMMRTPATWLMPLYVVTFAASMGSRGPLVLAMASRRWAGRALGRATGILLAAIGIGGGFGAWFGGFLQDTSGYEAVFGASGVALGLGALAWWAVLRDMRPSTRLEFPVRSANSVDAE